MVGSAGPALNHFFRNTDQAICDEDSQHNDSVLTRLTMRHERFLPSVSQENTVSIYAALVSSNYTELCPSPCGEMNGVECFAIQKHFPHWITSDPRVNMTLCCFITEEFRIQSGISDKHSIKEKLYSRLIISALLWLLLRHVKRSNMRLQGWDFLENHLTLL